MNEPRTDSRRKESWWRVSLTRPRTECPPPSRNVRGWYRGTGIRARHFWQQFPLSASARHSKPVARLGCPPSPSKFSFQYIPSGRDAARFWSSSLDIVFNFFVVIFWNSISVCSVTDKMKFLTSNSYQFGVAIAINSSKLFFYFFYFYYRLRDVEIVDNTGIERILILLAFD